jgi:hypothetical protein
MALVLKDRVKESSASSGTGNITLGGAIIGYQSFNTAIPTGSVVYYCIHNLTSPYDNEWEVGYGTFTAPNTLSRDFVYESSNAGSLVNFTSGSQGLEVFITQPAEQAIYQETNGDLKLVDGVITVSVDGTESNTLANTTYQAFGTINSFIQMNQQNLSGGSDASTDYVATNDTGDDTKNYIDLGIGSSGYSSVGFPLHKANDGYLYVIGDGVNSANLVVGTGNTGNVIVHTGGINTPNIVVTLDTNQNASFANNVTITANVSANNANFTTAAYASSNVSLITAANQLATKEYVDNSTSAGIHIHEPVLVETTGNLNATYAQGGTTFNITTTISPNTVVTSTTHGLSVNDQIWLTSTAGNGLSTNTAYFVFSTPNATSLTLSTNYGGAQYTGISNGTGLTYATRANSGVGATLTNAGANVALTVDSISLANTNRVMVRLQTNPAENGVYVVSNPGNGSAQWVLTRATDADYFSPVDTNGLGEGDYFYTQSGAINAGDSHVLTTPGNIIIGYTNLTYTQFSGSVVYTGTAPINVSGQTIALTGTVGATNGGTGANTVSTGDLLYGSATDTWSKLPLGSAYKSLLVNASGTQVEWNAVALNQSAAVSGNLAATNGGTGIGSYTQGDMLYANTTTQLDKVTPNQTTTRKFLSQTGTGTTANAPGWNQPDAADITGLGTMATQNANNVSITGGTLNNVAIGGTTANTGTFTTVSATTVNATTGNFTNVSGNGVALTDINASNISSGTIANTRTTASNANSASTIVSRDANGSFGANIITATFSGNGATLSAINASNISSGTIANARTTAASANGASTIVARDSGGNFSANTVTAAVIGDLSGGSNINASNIASGTIANARTTASSSNGASTIVLRGSSGEFAAGAITGTSFSGNGSGLTNINASSITTGTLDNARTTASSANGANTIVLRDANGSFSGNVITGTTGTFTNISGNGASLTAINASNITSGTIANARTTASDANGASTIVSRDANGSFTANVVTTTTISGNGASLTGINASNISSGTIANARTTAASANGANTIVLRGALGEFSAGIITADGSGLSAINASNISSGTIVNARTTADSANGASTIVARDTNGSFSANVGTFTTVSGAGSGLTGINASNISSGTVATARLASGTADSTTFLRGDQTWATAGGGATITDDTATNATRFILFDDATSGTLTSVNTSSSKLTFNPSTGTLSSTVFSGAGTGLTGTASSLSIGGSAASATSATSATTATTANALNTGNNYQVNSIGVGAAASGTAGRINSTTAVITPGTSGVSTGLTVINGDITTYRSGGTSGVIYLSSSGSHYLFWDGTNYNLNAGALVCTGNITAFSDEKLKKNWRPVQDNFVSKLAQVKSGVYDRTDEESTQIGVSAQSLQKVMPQSVIESENGTLSVAYGSAALAACVELAKEVVKLKEELNALKGK